MQNLFVQSKLDRFGLNVGNSKNNRLQLSCRQGPITVSQLINYIDRRRQASVVLLPLIDRINHHIVYVHCAGIRPMTSH